jgi:hypothetical protein
VGRRALGFACAHPRLISVARSRGLYEVGSIPICRRCARTQPRLRLDSLWLRAPIKAAEAEDAKRSFMAFSRFSLRPLRLSGEFCEAFLTSHKLRHRLEAARGTAAALLQPSLARALGSVGLCEMQFNTGSHKRLARALGSAGLCEIQTRSHRRLARVLGSAAPMCARSEGRSATAARSGRGSHSAGRF